MSTTEPIRMLGRYELLRRIAKGGMGEIYLARTRGMAGFEKNCIIKTILPHLAEEEEFVTKFLDEGRIVVQLVHGNIVPVFDMGDEAGEVFMAMEYIPGRDLREVTKRLAGTGEVMPVDLALFVAGEVCKGLDYAHRKAGEDGKSLGIVHRDVSPSNVLISREGEIKLIDFGIARAAGRIGKTVSGRIQGKFCYMSPEQAAGQPVDGRSDIFSAGLVLYELLTGFRPFEGGTDLESLDLVRQCEFDPPGALNAEVPEEIDELVCKALAKDPLDRFQSADKFQIAILQYLYSTGSSPTPSDLAAFLGELFPEGLEREELRSARDASGSPGPPKKMSLDEALDFELGKLSGSSSGVSGPTTVEVDPHETTAVSSGELELARNASVHTQSPSTRPERPVETDEAESATREVTRRPALWWAVLVVGLVLAAGAVYAFTSSTKGVRTIDSDPPGAQISVDGLMIPGAVTPHELKLEAGTREIALELDGHETRKIALTVEADTREAVPTTRLRPIVEASGPRTITLHATPSHATFTRDGVVLGQPLVTLKPGDLATIVAQAEGCDSMSKQIEYGYGNRGVNFDLSCSEPDADAGAQQEAEDAPTPKTITIKSEPAGATITVNGKNLGAAPATWSGMSNELLRIQAKHGDNETSIRRQASRFTGNAVTLKLTPKPAAAGCLKFSIEWPFVADWQIADKRLPNTRGTQLELPAGRHTLRVANEKAGLDHRQTVDVKPGDDCTELYLDGRKLKK